MLSIVTRYTVNHTERNFPMILKISKASLFTIVYKSILNLSLSNCEVMETHITYYLFSKPTLVINQDDSAPVTFQVVRQISFLLYAWENVQFISAEKNVSTSLILRARDCSNLQHNSSFKWIDSHYIEKYISLYMSLLFIAAVSSRKTQ